MNLEVVIPSEFQGSVIGGLNKRGGLILDTNLNDDGSSVSINADVSLCEMFGYSTDLRSATQGKGEFSMEYKTHSPVARDTQDTLIKAYIAKRTEENE